MRNVEMYLLIKGNFKRSTECDEFDKICLDSSEYRSEIEELQSTKLDTNHKNRMNHKVDVDIFRIHFI